MECYRQHWCSGQGNGNPLVVFADHAIVKKGAQIYDPSYGGNFYDSLDDWKATNVVGYGAQFMKENEAPCDFYLYVGETN